MNSLSSLKKNYQLLVKLTEWENSIRNFVITSFCKLYIIPAKSVDYSMPLAGIFYLFFRLFGFIPTFLFLL